MGDKQKLVVDTSCWMNNKINEDIIKRYNIIVPYIILQELDGLKESENQNTAYKSRRAIRFIDNNFNNLNFVQHDDGFGNNDDKIIDTAKRFDAAVSTDDICFQVKAKTLKIPIIELEEEKEEYKGYKKIELDTNNINDNQILANIYENPYKNLWNLYTNQYLIIKDKNNKTLDIFRWTGKRLVKLKLPPKKVIKPFNDLQACALDLLCNKNIPIKFLCGHAGSGKTYLATQLGFYYTLEKGSFSKILVCRNPLGAGSNIGFLPGDKIDKVGSFYTPIKQNAERLDINELIECGQLEFEIPFYIKGNTYNNTWMIVEESEDMNKKLLSLIGTRIGYKSCITFCGDYNQSEKQFKNDNGLKYAIEKLKGNPLVGIVFLEDNVRSDASGVFLDLM